MSLATASCDLWQKEHFRTSVSVPERDLTIGILLSQNRCPPENHGAITLPSCVWQSLPDSNPRSFDCARPPRTNSAQDDRIGLPLLPLCGTRSRPQIALTCARR